jgi:hypothetical protein
MVFAGVYARAMEAERSDSATYEITIEGQIDHEWSEWLENLAVTFPSATTTLLRGNLADQVALFGVLRKLHNLGMCLIAVRRVDTGQKE